MLVSQSKLAWLTPNLGILWISVCSFWLCGSIVANPIICRLVPSPSRHEIRQCGKLRDCFTRYTNPQLIAKFKQILCETSCEWWPSRKAKICCLKSTRSLLFGTTSLSLKVKNSVETVIAKVRVFVSNISSPPLKRRYERSIWVFVFFFVIHVGGLHVFNKNLKVYLYM